MNSISVWNNQGKSWKPESGKAMLVLKTRPLDKKHE